MTSKIIVNTIEADTGISSVTFASNINLQNDSSILVSSSGIRLGTGSTIAAPSANEIALSTNSAERFRVDSSGRLLVGHTSSVSSLADVKIEAVSGAGAEIHLARNDSSVTDGNAIGILRFYGNDGGTYQECARINCQADGTHADGDKPSRLTFYTTPSGAQTSTERLRIASDGDLTLTGADNVEIKMKCGTSSGNNILAFLNSSGTTRGNITYDSDNNFLLFNVNQSERLRIDSDGRLLAGGATASNAWTGGDDLILGNTNSGTRTGITLVSHSGSDGGIYWSDGTSANVYRGQLAYNHANDTMSLYTAAAARLRIDSSGRALIGSPNGSTSQLLQIKGDTGAANNGGTILLQNGVADSSAGNGTGLGGIAFGGATGNQYCRIEGFADGSGGTNDYPGRIVFSTTADAASSPTERMRITSAGYVLKSDTPAFNCKLSGATGANFTGVLVFGSVQYNIGSHYNSSNGRFTAPVDGRYLFSWYTNMERAGGNGSFYADWKINGNNQGNRMYTHHSGAWEQICGTIIFDLNANDYVEINAITSGNWDGGQYGSYSGYLLG